MTNGHLFYMFHGNCLLVLDDRFDRLSTTIIISYSHQINS